MKKDDFKQLQKRQDLDRLFRQVNNLRNSIVNVRNSSNAEFSSEYDKMKEEVKRLNFFLIRMGLNQR